MVSETKRKQRVYPGRNQKGLYKVDVESTTILNKSFTYKGKYCVYALAASDKPDVVRYIGFTSDKPNKRYNNHLKPSSRDKSSKAKWVEEVLNMGDKLIMTLIEDGIETHEEACQAEKDYIKGFRDAGTPLTNMTAGGIGTEGLRHKPETKIKQKDAWKGRGKHKKKVIMMESAPGELRVAA